MCNRLCQRHPGNRGLACLEPIGRALLEQPRLRVMMGEHFRLGFRGVRKAILDHPRDLAVQPLTPALEQPVVGRIPDQVVLEGVSGLGKGASSKRQLWVRELLKCGGEFAFDPGRHGFDQLVAELSTDGRVSESRSVAGMVMPRPEPTYS